MWSEKTLSLRRGVSNQNAGVLSPAFIKKGGFEMAETKNKIIDDSGKQTGLTVTEQEGTPSDEVTELRHRVAVLERAIATGATQPAAPVSVTDTMGADGFINDTRDALKKQKHYKISIPSTETQKDPIHVAINGYAYNIPRDTEVSLPESVIEVLKNAKYTTYSLKKRGEGEEGNELVGQDVQRFPFQSVGN